MEVPPVKADRASTFHAILLQTGDDLGLFDEMEKHGALAASELAAQTACQLNYLQSWLEIMEQYGVIEHDRSTGLFSLRAKPALYKNAG